jgi:polyhydroxyalkanoate synthase
MRKAMNIFDPAQVLAQLLGGSRARGHELKDSKGKPSADAGERYTALANQMGQAQQEFIKQMMGVWTKADDSSTEGSDKRFAGHAWQDDPRFDAVRKGYLAYSKLFQSTVDAIPLDAKTKAQLRFGMRQLTDAMSPSNFFLTNPEALQLAVETRGESVAKGMSLFLDDLAKGRVSTTDESAYQLGKDLATMPGQVIFENELMQLIQYEPAGEKVYETPLVMVPPCINKFYILDLQPENSLVRYMREQGHTVFMLSWRNVGRSQGHFTWDDYVEMGVIQAIDVAREVARVDQVNAMGFCIGGTLLTSAMAVTKARNENGVKSLTLLTSMLDFSDAGEIGSLVSEQSVAAREATVGHGGIVRGSELSFTFTSLRANDLMWQYVTNSYLKGKAPPAFDMLHWNADNTNLPGPMFCWYVRNCYLENNLGDPGGTMQCGHEVDLSLVDAPAFVYASRDDHIVPWRTAYASRMILSGETMFVLGASGHIAGVINPPTKQKRNYWVGGADGPDPDKWLDTARSVPGSWWPEWAKWLEKLSGDKVKATKAPGNRRLQSIESAPGRYVTEKA